MKKYLLCLVLLAGLVIITGNDVQAKLNDAQAELNDVQAESFVQNTITNSQVQQYILINCQERECLTLVEALKKLNKLNGGVEAEAPMDDSLAGPVEKLNLDTDKVSPSSDEEVFSTVVMVNQQTVDAGNAADSFVGGEDIVEQNKTTQPVQVETTDSAISVGNETAGPSVVTNKTAVGAKQIRINEVMPSPLTGQKEWVELYNSLDFSVDLSNWQLVEGAGKITKLNGVVNANNFIVFEKDSLNNSGDIIILKDAGGLIIDSLTYGDWDDGNSSDNAPKPANGQSLILSEGNYFISDAPTPNLPNVLPLKKTAGDVQEPAPVILTVQTADVVSPTVNVQPLATAVPAPPATASTVNPVKIEEQASAAPVYQFSDKIFINEFLADPSGDDDQEWIELFNDGVEPVNLFGWSLDDAEGGSKLFSFKEAFVIGAKDFLVFKKEKTELVLNNSADSVVLRDSTGKEISRFDYKNPKEGFSFAKFSDGRQETSILTPGALNQKSTLQVAQYAIAPASSKLIPAKKQSLTVKNVPPEESKTTPLKITAADIGSELVGKLVQLSGTLVEKKAKKLILADDSAEFVVYLKPGAKIDSKIYELTNKLEVRGVIGNFNGEWRLLPRSKDDIVNLSLPKLDLPQSEGTLSESTRGIGRKETIIVLVLLFGVVTAVNAYLAVVHRQIIADKTRQVVNRMRQSFLKT